MKKKIILFMVVLTIAGTVNAATEDEKQAAINAGLVWLANNQLASGAWVNGGSSTVGANAATGSAMLAFLEEGYRAGTNVVIGGTDYGDVVGKGLNYLYGQATLVDIVPPGAATTPAGNPDGDGNGYGVRFDRYTNSAGSGWDIYTTGIVTTALARTGTPNAVVNVAGSAVNGWTHKQVVQNAIDYFAYGQTDSGTYEGGWRYTANAGADNSTAQWGAIAGLFAQGVGVSSPAFVKTELDKWVGYIQYLGANATLYGSSGYTSPTIYNNMSKTGGLLAEMAFTGLSAPSDVSAALAYLNRNWQNYTPSGTWYGNFDHPYAMWSVYKGLETTIGLGDTATITNLRAFNPTTMNLDPGDTWNWWEDYCEWLVDRQLASGAWGGYSNWTGALATGWYINILNATRVVIPVPAAYLLCSIGLAVSGWKLRRRKEL